MQKRIATLRLGLALLLFAAVHGCGGGGGGGGSVGFTMPGGGDIALMAITFPEVIEQIDGAPTAPPEEAPLSQQVVFVFSGLPDGNPGYKSLQIFADVNAGYDGPEAALDKDKNIVPARGMWESRDHIVVFTPYYPVVPIDLSRNAPLEAVPGLLPDLEYTVYVPLRSGDSIANLVAIHPSVTNPVDFTTVSSELPNLYYQNHPDDPPQVTATVPRDGATDVPVHTLSGAIPGFPPEEEFCVSFDQPLLYSDENIAGDDLDEDGSIDQNIFFLFPDRTAYAALDAHGGDDPGIISIDRKTGEAEFVGVTALVFDPQTTVGLKSIAVERSGLMLGTSGEYLFDVEYRDLQQPGYCFVSSPRIHDGYTDVRGLALAPDDTLYALDGTAGHLLTIDRGTGNATLQADLGSLYGTWTDLAIRADGTLYGMAVVDSGLPGALSTLLRLDPESGDTTFLFSAAADYTSIDMAGFMRISFCSGAALEVDLFDLETAQLDPSGSYTLSGGGLSSGAPLNIWNRLNELGMDASLADNSYLGATVVLVPSGILPFGERMEILVRRGLAGISLGSLAWNGDAHPMEADCVAAFTTYDPGAAVVDDVFVEEFVGNDWEASSAEYGGESLPRANWNVQDVDGELPHYEHLLATYGLTGDGGLGDFKPLGIYPTVILDTNYQPLPLFDGSTPDVIEQTVVEGGVFHFRSIVIPESVTVVGIGSNPLVLTATETIEIAGKIDLSGMPGIDDVTFDSAFTPTPGGKGGAGGGRGGMSNPSIPENFQVLTDLRSPRGGEDGWGYSNLRQSGGKGGESGARGTDVKWQSAKPDKKSRGAGGGGGSFFIEGGQGYHGLGMYGADPTHPDRYIARDSWWFYDGHPDPVLDVNYYETTDPPGGAAGDAVFPDGDPSNDYIGEGGEVKYLRGGQGGGGAGSRLDSMNPETIPKAQQWFPPVDRSAYDAKGGGGGGAGGGLALVALDGIVLRSTASILASGGRGGGGEVIGHANFGGAGGGGSGGAVILDSAEKITIESGAVIDVSGGWPGDAKEMTVYSFNNLRHNLCLNPNLEGQLQDRHFKLYCSWSQGDGGFGGHGLVQLQVPPPVEDNLVYEEDSIFADLCLIDWRNDPICKGNDPVTNPRCGCNASGIDTCAKKYHHYLINYDQNDYPSFPRAVGTDGPLVDPSQTPTTLGPKSYGLSRWIDTGQVIDREDVSGLPAPFYQDFIGILQDGTVYTENGYIPNPDQNDIRVDAPDLLMANYIPDDNQVQIVFQGADALLPGSGIPDPSTIVPGPGQWTANLRDLAGKQFIRFSICLDTAVNVSLTPDSTKPQVNYVRIRVQY